MAIGNPSITGKKVAITRIEILDLYLQNSKELYHKRVNQFNAGCTYLNVLKCIFEQNPNIEMESWNFEIFGEKLAIFNMSSALDIRLEMVVRFLPRVDTEE